MADRAQRERALRAENRRLKASLDAIHNALHANEVDQAHELWLWLDGKPSELS